MVVSVKVCSSASVSCVAKDKLLMSAWECWSMLCVHLQPCPVCHQFGALHCVKDVCLPVAMFTVSSSLCSTCLLCTPVSQVSVCVG